MPMTVGAKKGSETKRSRGSARAKIAKKRHDVCRSSLINRETKFTILYIKNVGASRDSRCFNALMV